MRQEKSGGLGGFLSIMVLLVDDDAAVRKMVRRVLGARDYAIVDAADGVEALDRLESLGGGQLVDLLVTDVLMPRMGGLPLATQMRIRQPTIRVLFISGYSGGVLPLVQAFAQPAILLEKPFTVEELLASVDRLLAAGDPRLTRSERESW